MRRALLSGIFLLLAGLTGARAEDGRVRVIRPIVITAPGYYLVAQDIDASSGPVISIRSNNVTLDLGGHVLSTTATDVALIQLDGPLQNVEVKGGTLLGGRQSIASPPQSGGVSLRVEEVEMVPAAGIPLGTGIRVASADYVEVRSCRITAPTGISIDSEVGGGAERNWRGRLFGNTLFVSSRGMVLEGLTGGEVRENLIRKSPAALTGILLIRGNGGNRVAENQIGEGGGDAIAIESRAWDVDGNMVSGNVLTGNGGHGVVTDGNGALLEGNVISANSGCGITFRFSFSVPEGNAYRTNMLRGNTGGGVCGFPNTDAGGNIL
jgi:parallel beta helix pectate lyase-like protein